MTEALIVFARAPVAGRVKHRLAASVGETRAVRVYAALLGHALQLSASWPGARELCVADDEALRYFSTLPAAAGHGLTRQVEADLGQRMQVALETALREHGTALLMGSDVVDNTAEDLSLAALWLREGADVVLGPAVDGGYWLLGLRQPVPGLFTEMPWGGPEVYARTLEHCRSAGLQVRVLAPRHDLDEASDLERHRAALTAMPAVPLA